jgi:sporulation protein YlmC with PRC-barrel domain
VTALRELIGRRVVSGGTAEALGDIDGALVDATSHQVTHLYVRHGRSDTFVGWNEIDAVGPDAVVLGADVTPHAPQNDREKSAASGKLTILGKRVLDDLGFAHGEVADLDFDAETGAVTSLTVEDATLPPESLLGIGAYAVVIRAPAEASADV